MTINTTLFVLFEHHLKIYLYCNLMKTNELVSIDDIQLDMGPDNDMNIVSQNDIPNDPSCLVLNKDLTKIPDLVKLTDTIVAFMEYINTPEMLQLDESLDKTLLEKHLEAKFSDFAISFTTIFKMLLNKDNRNENITKLIDLINILRKVKSGERDIDIEFDKFREELSEQYVYPQFGGKEKFEKNIKNRATQKGMRE